MTSARLLLCGLLLLGLTAAAAAAPTSEGEEFFESQVRPLLVEKCLSCHGPKRQQAGLRLDSRADFLKGGDSGPIVKPGDPDGSLLIRAVRYSGELKMPPKNQLPAAAVEVLTRWVRMGAPWPETTVATRPGTPGAEDARKQHWSFQPPRLPVQPAVKDAAWPVSPIDRFILAKLEEKGLHPSAPADRRTLLRRAWFDVVGLPPGPEEVEAFVNDASPAAFAKAVDRLLASPQYGERWARHWLDVARYADTKGYVFEEERRYPFAYTYRDWVIRAFNEDLPYDQFLIQQVAADRLPGEDKRPLAAMGFLTLGRRFLNNQADIIDDRIDVLCRGLMGLTVACARCHDHKFDPIPQKDYYSLYGVFASSQEPKELPKIASPAQTPEQAAYEKELQRLQAEVDKYQKEHETELKAGNRLHKNELRKRQQKVDAHKATHPGAPASAMVLEDLPRPVQQVVFLRGNPNNRGEAVPRQFLSAVAGEKRKPFTDGSGRLELAKAIASRDNPLTARVFVNRVWMHYFGTGIVRTTGDFGLRGDPPTHPELLDWLAVRFMEDGWSIKKLHRQVLLSRTYQQASTTDPKAAAIDPDNRLVSRMNRKRLEFEPLRDAILAVSGKLDRTAGGPAVDLTKAPFPARRTVYGFIDRQNLPEVFRTFDLASPDASTPQRHQTTVPQQALFLMNSPFVAQQAKALAARSDVQAKTQPAERVRYLYRLLYGREADADEVTVGCQYVAAAAPDGWRRLTAWEQYAQVLLLSNEFAFVD